MWLGRKPLLRRMWCHFGPTIRESLWNTVHCQPLRRARAQFRSISVGPRSFDVGKEPAMV
jgi:hypothetical protein